MRKKKEPAWYASNYRQKWDFKKGKDIVLHKKPLRCPYCGGRMKFANPKFYEYSPERDWFWFCPECGLKLPNKNKFTKKELDRARKGYRRSLSRDMKEAKEWFERVKKLYNSFGRYFTPEEKRNSLIEAIEAHKPKGRIG